jgi:hypothetical protein
MYGAIFAFQRLTLWPKCTPDPAKSRMVPFPGSRSPMREPTINLVISSLRLCLMTSLSIPFASRRRMSCSVSGCHCCTPGASASSSCMSVLQGSLVPHCPWSAVASSSDLPSCCGTFCLVILRHCGGSSSVPYEHVPWAVQGRRGG